MKINSISFKLIKFFKLKITNAKRKKKDLVTVQTQIVVIFFSCMYFTYKRSTRMKKQSLLFESAR